MKALFWIAVGTGVFAYTLYLPEIDPKVLDLPSAGKAMNGLLFVGASVGCVLHGLINKTGWGKCRR